MASIPKRALAKIAAATLDATAFPTYASAYDYRVQREVGQAIRDAMERGDTDPVPKGVILGPDGNLQRCKSDPIERTSKRTARSETNYRPDCFTGYFVKFATACRDYYFNHDSFRLRYDIAPCALGLCCDPASDNNAPVARELCLALEDAHSALRTVTADREFTPRLSFAQQWRCDGSISIGVEDLNQWQPAPWGTRAHKKLYAAGRDRIENSNGIAKDGGGVNKKSRRAPGVPAHSMAALARAVVSNVKFADEDPREDPPTDHFPEAEPSLFCIMPALDNTTFNGGHPAALPSRKAHLPPRAPS